MGMLSTGLLSNINWKVQRELFRIMETPRGELESQSVRSIWIRMTSGGEEMDSEQEGFGNPTILCGGELTPELEMRYGSPPIEEGIKNLVNHG